MDNTREEFNRLRKRLPKMRGCTCVNCGSTDSIEYHHIVPLSRGGTNNLLNIVPLCINCHGLAHKTIFRHSDNSGRPRNDIPANYESILDMYMQGILNTNQTKKYLNIESESSKLYDRPYFKEYLKNKGIKYYKRSGGRRGNKRIMILYEDGSFEQIIRDGRGHLVERLEWTRQ